MYVYPHLLVHESPHLSRASGQLFSPSPPGPATHHHHARSLCVKPEPPPVKWTHEVNDNDIHPSQRDRHYPPCIQWLNPNNAPATQVTTSRGVPQHPATLNPPPFTPPTVSKGLTSRSSGCFEDTPSGVNIPAETACS